MTMGTPIIDGSTSDPRAGVAHRPGQPFGGPGQVLKYLARYTHQVAISNHRLRSLSDGRVWFRYKDYARGGQRRTMERTATEFLRRFLQHVLPTGFVRIRSYGFLAHRHRREKLAVCRELLTAAAPLEAMFPGVPSPAASLGPGPGVTEVRGAGSHNHRTRNTR